MVLRTAHIKIYASICVYRTKRVRFAIDSLCAKYEYETSIINKNTK